MNANQQKDLARALRTGRYEKTDDGRIYIEKGGFFAGGSFVSDVNGKDKRLLPNLFSAEGLTYVLASAFHGISQATAFYLAPFSGNKDATGALTAANFAQTQTEFTGYDEPERQAWTLPGTTMITPSIGNAASVATFTNNVAAATIWGFALLTASPKQATSGRLIACFKDETPRDNLRVGDKVNLQYTITATDGG